MSSNRTIQLPILKSKPQRVREMQIQHLKLLKLIDNNCLGLRSRKALLPLIESLYCIQLDSATARTWDESQMDEFEKRCQWERNVRSDFIYGASPREDTFKYYNPYATLAASVTKVVRSPEVDRKVDRSQIVISPIITKLRSASCTPSSGKQTPLATIEETPEETQWFELPGKKKVLEIRKVRRRANSQNATLSPPSPCPGHLPTTPPSQILPRTTPEILESASTSNDDAAADKRFKDAWSTDQFDTPETSDRTVNWASRDASAIIKNSSDSSASSTDYQTAIVNSQPASDTILEDLAAQLDKTLVSCTPRPSPGPLPVPRKVSTEQEKAARRKELMQERYVPIRLFDMNYWQNRMAPGVEDNDY